MATTTTRDDERWPRIVAALLHRGLDGVAAPIAADYCIECLDELEAEFEKEREPFA
jgi:hypothetical protein